MDRLIYTAMTGAKHILEQQANTCEQPRQRHHHRLPRPDRCLPRRAGRRRRPAHPRLRGRRHGRHRLHARPAPADRPRLDVAIQGKGWLARADRRRHRSLHPQRQPEDERERPAADPARPACSATAARSAMPPDVTDRDRQRRHHFHRATAAKPGAPSILGRLKLVNPPEDNLVRGDDGLFRMQGRQRRPTPTPRSGASAARSKAATSTWSTRWST